jgi:hypothetical protein
MRYAFQDGDNLFAALEYMGGGDLLNCMENHDFPEEWHVGIWLAEHRLFWGGGGLLDWRFCCLGLEPSTQKHIPNTARPPSSNGHPSAVWLLHLNDVTSLTPTHTHTHTHALQGKVLLC